MTSPSWYKDLVDPTAHTRNVAPSGFPTPPTFAVLEVKSKKDKAPAKPRPKSVDQEVLKVKKAWEVALAPAKSLPMNLFMSYMSGNSLQIVPITMTVMMFFITPMKQIMGVRQQFRHLETESNHTDMLLTMTVYVLCHFAAIGAGVWKLGQMGLLPNTRSDWLPFESGSHVSEFSW